MKGETATPSPSGESPSPHTCLSLAIKKLSAKSPSYPGPMALDSQDNALWALQEGGLIRLKGGALPGCKISQQAGWVRGGEEVVRREFREEENRKQVHSPHFGVD